LDQKGLGSNRIKWHEIEASKETREKRRAAKGSSILGASRKKQGNPTEAQQRKLGEGGWWASSGQGRSGELQTSGETLEFVGTKEKRNRGEGKKKEGKREGA